MKRFLPLTIFFIALMSATASADHLYLYPNCCGDNFGLVTHMNGHPLILSGGTDPFVFSDAGYLPGSTFGGGGTLFLYSTVAWIDGMPLEFFFSPGSIFISSITLPTNGKDFRVPVDISFFISGFNYDTQQTLNLSGGAHGSVSFSFSDANGLYFAGQFVESPEPGTLALIGTGLAGIVAVSRRRLGLGQRSTRKC